MNKFKWYVIVVSGGQSHVVRNIVSCELFGGPGFAPFDTSHLRGTER